MVDDPHYFGLGGHGGLHYFRRVRTGSAVYLRALIRLGTNTGALRAPGSWDRRSALPNTSWPFGLVATNPTFSI